MDSNIGGIVFNTRSSCNCIAANVKNRYAKTGCARAKITSVTLITVRIEVLYWRKGLNTVHMVPKMENVFSGYIVLKSILNIAYANVLMSSRSPMPTQLLGDVRIVYKYVPIAISNPLLVINQKNSYIKIS